MPERTDEQLVVVLTALDLEYQAVRAHLTNVSLDSDAGTVFRIGSLPRAGLRIALASTGDGNLGAAAIATRAITTYAPRALLFVGVAGALKDDIDLGDVVVAERIYAYHGGKEQDGRFLVRPRSFEASHELIQFAHDLARESPSGAPGPDGTARRFRVHFKPIAAGEAVLDSATGPILEHLRLHYNDTAAIEMESAGAMIAAHIGFMPALVVRGISDRADGRKHAADSAGHQPEAAANASAFAMAVLRHWLASTPPRAPSDPDSLGASQSATSALPPVLQWIQNVDARGPGVTNAVQAGSQFNYAMDAPAEPAGTGSAAPDPSAVKP